MAFTKAIRWRVNLQPTLTTTLSCVSMKKFVPEISNVNQQNKTGFFVYKQV